MEVVLAVALMEVVLAVALIEEVMFYVITNNHHHGQQIRPCPRASRSQNTQSTRNQLPDARLLGTQSNPASTTAVTGIRTNRPIGLHHHRRPLKRPFRGR